MCNLAAGMVGSLGQLELLWSSIDADNQSAFSALCSFCGQMSCLTVLVVSMQDVREGGQRPSAYCTII